MAEDRRKYKGKKFINIFTSAYGTETIEEFDNLTEAKEALRECAQLYVPHGVSVWISSRPDKSWYGE